MKTRGGVAPLVAVRRWPVWLAGWLADRLDVFWLTDVLESGFADSGVAVLVLGLLG